jgi:hypothetical protein
MRCSPEKIRESGSIYSVAGGDDLKYKNDSVFGDPLKVKNLIEL